jgi:pectate lyase
MHMNFRTSKMAFLGSVCGLFATVSCSDHTGTTDSDDGFSSGGNPNVAGGGGSPSAGTGGQASTTGGNESGTGGDSENGSGGLTNSGGAAGSGGLDGGSGGLGNGAGGMDGGSGGAAGSGGTGNGAGGMDGGSGGSGATGCEAVGWATRDGRTGGAVAVIGGGDGVPVVVSSFGDLQNAAEDDTPRVIHVDGTVGSGWSGTTGDRLEVGSNKTIVGLRPSTELRAPIHVNGSSNVIIRNLVIQGPGSNSDQAWDNINIEGSSKNVWIDHCEFWDGQDGNADVVKGADNVTFTWNIFGYRTGGEHNFSNLVASSDDEPESEGKLNITLMFNWFTGVAQRQPRCRYGDIHVVNNLFSQDGQTSDYGISAGKDCRVLTENNHFIDIASPIYTSHASGTAANELRGDNIFENTSGNTTGYGTAFEPPYEYQSLLVSASEVKALVEQKVGATLASPTDCD